LKSAVTKILIDEIFH